MKIHIIVILAIVLKVNTIKFQRSNTEFKAFPCGTQEIISKFRNLNLGYKVTVKKPLTVSTDIRLVFDSEAIILLDDGARFSRSQDNVYNIFNLLLVKNTDEFTFTVKGHSPPYAPPYLTSLKIGEDEYCRNHNLSYFEDFPVGVLKRQNVPDKYCGKRKIFHTELIVGGASAKPGDWPWHAALYHQRKGGLTYVCGGTLISKYFVLTAAHCTTIDGVPVLPDILGVYLGKYNLYGSDISIQERQVFQVIVHDEFSTIYLNNDISLLKLKTQAVFNNYVQPACLWYEDIYDKLPSYEIQGTVVGWGFDSSDSLTSTLHSSYMPVIPELTCIYSNEFFYANHLRSKKKFCAGYQNGTSACNGDSGGGFVVFVPDMENATTTNVPGAYYVKGIVSASLKRADKSVCDPNAYALFTDVSKYLEWIKDNMT